MIAVHYYGRHRDALFRFIDDPDIPIDNSATEREFQNVAKLRFNMLFAGSTEGAHRACVLLGIIATCRALGVSAQAYFAWAFDRLGTHRERPAARGTSAPGALPRAAARDRAGEPAPFSKKRSHGLFTSYRALNAIFCAPH
jgi:hypothetical protein